MTCEYCDEPILPTDWKAPVKSAHLHGECAFRMVSGCVEHGRGGQMVCDGTCRDDPGLTRRQAAQAAFDEYRKLHHGHEQTRTE